jgi:RNA polymerase sigma factor (sigma-70 family)
MKFDEDADSKKFVEVLSGLTFGQRLIFKELYLDGLTLEEIAKRHGVTREGVKQFDRTILISMRQHARFLRRNKENNS